MGGVAGGRYLVVAAAGQGSPDYHITIVDLARPSSRDLLNPAWSPDGSQIAVTATVHKPYRD